jgi:hypothetical protein
MSTPEFYLTLATRCREVAAMMTRDDLRARLERIIAELEQQAMRSGELELALSPTKEPALK